MLPHITHNPNNSDYQWQIQYDHIKKETSKAFFIDLTTILNESIWFPKTQCMVDATANILHVTDWIIKQKGIKDELTQALRDYQTIHKQVPQEIHAGPVYKRQLQCPHCKAVDDYNNFTEPTVTEDKFQQHSIAKTGKPSKPTNDGTGRQKPGGTTPPSDIPF